jgi:hypothetical protein
MTIFASCRATAASSSNETGPMPTVTLRCAMNPIGPRPDL